MAQRWNYLGPLGPRDALDWDAPGGGNIPASGRLPDVFHHELYMKIKRLADEGRYGGKIIDWDAYGLRVNGPELEAVLREAFAAEPEVLSDEPLSLYMAEAARLGPDRYAALVAVAM